MRPARVVVIAMLVCAPPASTGAQVKSPAKPSSPTAPTPVASAPAGTISSERSFAWAHVTYISGATIYLDAGTKAGVREGTVFEVMRGATRVAELVVAYVSSSRSSATARSATGEVTVGDSARFTPVAVVAEAPKADSLAARSRMTGPSPQSARRSVNPIRGRIGVRYLTIKLDGDATSTLSQPALDLRLDGHNIGGSPIGLVVDVRAYRQLITRPGSSTPTLPRSSTRVYQTALVFNPTGRATRVTLGRQFSGAIAPIGLFDGVSLDFDKARWSFGAFSGSQPDVSSFGYSGAIREHGAYVQLHNTPAGHYSWALTSGGVGSYSRGEIDREFAYLQGTFNSRWLSLYASQELDVNRGWKADAEKSSTTPTALYATARVSLGEAFSFFGGMDSRRSVRLYRDFVNPETAFDDTFRQGAWGGAQVAAFANRLRLSGDARRSSGGIGGEAQSYTGMFALTRLTPLQLGLHLRATQYDGSATRGTLQSAALEVNPWGRMRVEGNVGERRDRRSPLDGSAVPGVPNETRTRWFGADADLGIGRSLYLMLSMYRESAVGGASRTTQGNLAISWRF